jgi:hypothetical protein
LKKSAKNNEWSRRWFVLNEKSGKVNESVLMSTSLHCSECNLSIVFLTLIADFLIFEEVGVIYRYLSLFSLDTPRNKRRGIFEASLS